MSKNSIEKKPSETALFAALRRTIANKEFKNDKFGPDYLAEYFLPPHFRFFLKFKKIQANTKNKLNRFLPGLNEYMIARTVYFDRLFVDALNHQIPQIVLLGAGYDTRPYRFAILIQNTRIFELDSPPTQDRKKNYIKKARISVPKFVTLIPINFNIQSLGDVLEEAGYESNKKTLFIWEGVSYYLEAESVDRTLGFFRQTDQEQSRLAFDYTVTITEENINRYYGVKEFVQTMDEHHGSEALMFSIDEGETETLLEQRGLKMIEHLDNAEIEKTFLMEDNGRLLGQMTGHFRFVIAAPK